jgi:outer membrane protein
MKFNGPSVLYQSKPYHFGLTKMLSRFSFVSTLFFSLSLEATSTLTHNIESALPENTTGLTEQASPNTGPIARANLESPSDDTKQNTANTEQTDSELKNSIEIRADAFFPSSHLLRSIYGRVGPSYEIEACRTFNSIVTGWANFDVHFASGGIAHCNTSTKLWLINGGFGVKFPYQISSNIGVYLGAGLSFGGIWLKNKSRCDNEKISKFAMGYVAKSGFIFSLHRQVFLNLFADYLYQPVHFNRHVNLGGVRTGIGLGYNF